MGVSGEDFCGRFHGRLDGETAEGKYEVGEEGMIRGYSQD